MVQDRLDSTVRICESMLERAKETPRTSSRTFYGHGLFSKATQHGRSILHLLNAAAPTYANLDVGALCVLARCIIEIHNAWAYLLETGISKDEAHLRLHLFLLNHSTDLGRIGKYLATSRDEFWHQASRAWSVEELQKNSIFLSLDEPHRNNLLRGKSPYLHVRYSGKRPLPRDIESGLYILFSQNAHSFSLGLSPVIGGSQATPTGAANSAVIALHASIIYLSWLGLGYWRTRYRAIKRLDDSERRTLEDATSFEHLRSTLTDIRTKSAL